MLMITPETIPDQYVIRFTCLEHNQVIDQHHFFFIGNAANCMSLLHS